jgi:hypothetical protein
MTEQAPADPVVKQIARSIELLVRLKVEELRGDRNQSDMIRFLADRGATATEIASLMTIKRTTVDPIVSRARASAKPKKKDTKRHTRRK